MKDALKAQRAALVEEKRELASKLKTCEKDTRVALYNGSQLKWEVGQELEAVKETSAADVAAISAELSEAHAERKRCETQCEKKLKTQDQIIERRD
eukprot:4495115-Prymnesium_polylepis.1